MSEVVIRKAGATDAAAICRIVEFIVSEGKYTAITRAWNVHEETAYLASLSPREAVFVAEAAGEVIGFQVVDRWSAFDSMAHVAQLGTFLLPHWRGVGLGRTLFRASLDFAREAHYSKFLIQVRAGNAAALSFYRGLGFLECGRLTNQVRIHGLDEDEVLLERPIQ